ncbi:DUF1830 domain-containing protein [Leptodesmis sp.]|uniref:DUF1830 domain-containing protein n=1 Tax=Leptodesmis sp. TaxID=3100501 RepID=UPI0040534CD5
MTSAFPPLPSNGSGQILCYYVNSTAQIQRARIANIPDWSFERVVFPRQRLMFEALPEGLLEIHTKSGKGEAVFCRIPCLRLQVQETNRNAPRIWGG